MKLNTQYRQNEYSRAFFHKQSLHLNLEFMKKITPSFIFFET